MANDAGAIGPAGENRMINRSRFVPDQDPGRQMNSANIGSINNPYAYVKGVDFNSKQKYDYNILNGVPLGGAGKHAPSPSLQQAASQIMLS